MQASEYIFSLLEGHRGTIVSHGGTIVSTLAHNGLSPTTVIVSLKFGTGASFLTFLDMKLCTDFCFTREKKSKAKQSSASTTTKLAASASLPEELSGTTLPDELILEVLYRTRTLTLLPNVNEPPTHLYVLKPSQARKLDYPRKFNFPDFFKEMAFCGSINGIVCLSHSQHPDSCYFVDWGQFFVLWNPSMNCCKTIKLPAKKTILDMWEFVSVGIGFDADANDYKIIGIVPVMYPPSSEENIMSRVEIYSAKRDSWKDVDGGALIPLSPALPNCNFVIKGVPYWQVCGRENEGMHIRIVVCFTTVNILAVNYVILKSVK
ncbi:hypothetical protein POM88_012699 [Heracleum sosnowskyi]|uniref:F-box associated beta-propeller type 1 domain-containing protein n=1 Tax=Heracleum sosnowskyi TaxID=360622 RepID=A0AAD8IZ64_9APIA|nr:hypothetical protein POM88_012699 [Heracleum sosnowskyi]